MTPSHPTPTEWADLQLILAKLTSLAEIHESRISTLEDTQCPATPPRITSAPSSPQ